MLQALKQAATDRAPVNDDVRRAVGELLEEIDRSGLDAVRALSERFDSWDPADFRVSTGAIEQSRESVSAELADHIDFALSQVRTFARAQRNALLDLELETLPGVVLGHRLRPVARVGAYVPGGRYPLIATAFMTIAVPKVAGVETVIAVAPPTGPGGVEPATLYAMAQSGADEIYCLGGVQAVAAMAFGLLDTDAVDMLVGPGNEYVAEAKRQLFGRVGVDLIAGPSEILAVADATADPYTLAVDLVAQAEHGPTSRATLITWDRPLAQATLGHVARCLDQLPASSPAAEAWERRGEILLVDGPEAALEVSDELAIEHVHVQGADDTLALFADRLRNYGSLFLGASTTVVFGDKAIGTNHCLPTERGARYTGGLWVGSFLKALTFQRVTRSGAPAVAAAAEAIAQAEGMTGHARSAALRANTDALASAAQGEG